MRERLWNVGRFPDGSWTYGGRADDPIYEHCEMFKIVAIDGETAKRKAQSLRSRQQRQLKAKQSNPD